MDGAARIGCKLDADPEEQQTVGSERKGDGITQKQENDQR